MSLIRLVLLLLLVAACQPEQVKSVQAPVNSVAPPPAYASRGDGPCSALSLLDRRVDEVDLNVLMEACEQDRLREDERATKIAGRVLASLIQEQHELASVLVELFRHQGVSVRRCLPLRALALEMKPPDANAVAQCFPTWAVSQASRVITLLAPGSAELRVYASAGERADEMKVYKLDTGSEAAGQEPLLAVFAVVAPRGAPLSAYLRRGGSRELGAWRYRKIDDLDSFVSLLSRVPGCIVVETTDPSARVFVDGVKVPLTERITLDVGTHLLAVAGLSDGSAFTRPLEVSAGGCEKVNVDLAHRDDIWLVSLKLSEQCAELGVESSSVANALRDEGERIALATQPHSDARKAKSVGEGPKETFYQDGRHKAEIINALGTFDRSLAQGPGTGPLSFGRPIEDAARALLGSGVGRALLVEIDCAKADTASSITVSAASVLTREAWRQKPDPARFISEQAVTVGSTTELRRAIQTTLRLLYERASIRIEPPYEWSFYQPSSIDVSVQVAPGLVREKLEVQTLYIEDGKRERCAGLKERQRLAIEEPPLNRQFNQDYTTVTPVSLGSESDDIVPVAIHPTGPGQYVVVVQLVDTKECTAGKKDNSCAVVRARDWQCISLKEPSDWLRFDAVAGLATVSNAFIREFGQLPGSTYMLQMGATWAHQNPRWSPVPAVYLGYGFSTRTLEAPPNWEDIAAVAAQQPSGKLPIRWNRHNIRTGAGLQLNWDPGRHGYGGGYGDVSWMRGFIEAMPLVNIGFIDVSGVPAGLRSLRGNGGVINDLDVDVDVKVGFGIRTSNYNEFDVLWQLEGTAVDDAGGVRGTEPSVTNDFAFAMLWGVSWGLGL